MAGLGRNEFDDLRNECGRLMKCRSVLTFAELQAAFHENVEPSEFARRNDELAAEYDATLADEQQ